MLKFNDSLTKLSTSLDAQSKAFDQLRHVHRVAPAYCAAIVEQARRREFNRFYEDKIFKFQRSMASIFHVEEKRRLTFKQEILPYIPGPIESNFQFDEQGFPNLELISSTSVMSNDQGTEGQRTDNETAKQQTKNNCEIIEFQRLLERKVHGIPVSATETLKSILGRQMKQLQQIQLEFDKISLQNGLFTTSNTNPAVSQQPTLDEIQVYKDRIRNLELVLQEHYSNFNPAMIESASRDNQFIVDDLVVQIDELTRNLEELDIHHQKKLDEIQRNLQQSTQKLIDEVK